MRPNPNRVVAYSAFAVIAEAYEFAGILTCATTIPKCPETKQRPKVGEVIRSQLGVEDIVTGQLGNNLLHLDTAC
jgi:hypothetical protein